jgi:hypothetical protein
MPRTPQSTTATTSRFAGPPPQNAGWNNAASKVTLCSRGYTEGEQRIARLAKERSRIRAWLRGVAQVIRKTSKVASS